MAYSQSNSKGNTYYLHNRGRLFFFSKDPTDAVDLPENMTVVEGPTGMLMVKKKQ